jgi:hypothetical protein
MLDADCVLTAMSAENDMIQGLCITHTRITTIVTEYCLHDTVSPVSGRPAMYRGRQHRTAPMASTVLSAPSGAFSVSDTVDAVSPVFDRQAECRCVRHRTAPAACAVLCAPMGAFSVSDTVDADPLVSDTEDAVWPVFDRPA